MGAIAPSCVTRERATGEGWTGRIPLATPQTALSRRRPICLSCRHDRRRVTASTRRECARADSEGSHVFFFYLGLPRVALTRARTRGSVRTSDAVVPQWFLVVLVAMQLWPGCALRAQDPQPPPAQD